eukprot:m51a1_g11586 putative megakaryocyte-associated tyrosine-protein kinase-like (658) ;mRNA; r:63889-66671
MAEAVGRTKLPIIAAPGSPQSPKSPPVAIRATCPTALGPGSGPLGVVPALAPPSGRGPASAPSYPDLPALASGRRGRTFSRCCRARPEYAMSKEDLCSAFLSANLSPESATTLARTLSRQGLNTKRAITGLSDLQLVKMGVPEPDKQKLRMLWCQSDAIPFAVADDESEEEPFQLLSHVTPMESIGRGILGEVLKGTWESSEVALKAVQTAGNTDDLLRQARRFSELRHPNIVEVMGVTMHQGTLYIVEELAEGFLLQLVQSGMRRDTLALAARDIAAGMNYLTRNGVVHGRLRCKNVLYNTGPCHSLAVKVTDFGLVDCIPKAADISTMPTAWIAPEVLQGAQLTMKSDVWSMGVLIWELMNRGEEPWKGMDAQQITDAVLAGNRLPRPKRCPDELYEVMQMCWRPIDTRPGFKEVLVALDEYCYFSDKESPGKPLSLELSSLNSINAKTASYMMLINTGIEREESITFTINSRGAIIDVEQPSWDNSLKKNGGRHLLAVTVGTKLYDYISCTSVVYLYKRIVAVILDTRATIVLPCRLDSPGVRKHGEIQLFMTPTGHISITTRVTRTERRKASVDDPLPYDRHVFVCTFCKACSLGDDVWTDDCDSTERLPSMLSHACCPACFARITQIIADVAPRAVVESPMHSPCRRSRGAF